MNYGYLLLFCDFEDECTASGGNPQDLTRKEEGARPEHSALPVVRLVELAAVSRFRAFLAVNKGDIMMRILGTNKSCQLVLAAIAVVAMVQSDAMAWSYGSYGSSGSYGSYGSSGSYASYGSSGSYASYGSAGSHGSHGGLFARMRARHAARHAARSSHGSSGSYASYGSSGSYGSYGSHGVVTYSSSGSSGSYGSAVPAEAEYAPADEAPAEPESADPPADNSAEINVKLPENAIVRVNGAPTKSEGAKRSYVSKGLQPGRTYSYKLSVEFDHDGEKVVKEKTVRMRAGDRVNLSFGSEDSEQVATKDEPVKTALNVKVPADARVFLSGAATKQTGEERSFVTQQLAAGEQWEGYTVRVEVEQDGKTLVQERTLKVEGGESYELAFDFEQAEALQVAKLD